MSPRLAPRVLRRGCKKELLSMYVSWSTMHPTPHVPPHTPHTSQVPPHTPRPIPHPTSCLTPHIRPHTPGPTRAVQMYCERSPNIVDVEGMHCPHEAGEVCQGNNRTQRSVDRSRRFVSFPSNRVWPSQLTCAYRVQQYMLLPVNPAESRVLYKNALVYVYTMSTFLPVQV